MARIDGDWFRKKIKEKSLSQRKMAKFLNLDPAAVTLMLDGRRKIQIEEIEKISTFLNQPVSLVAEAAGIPLTPPTNTSESTNHLVETPINALIQKRDQLLAELGALNITIKLFEKEQS